jgi:two-component sensor histidine kinase/PAS domain-containing protein
METLSQKPNETSSELDRLRKRMTALEASVLRYRTLFENSPVALWEEDFSKVKSRIDAMRADGVPDFGRHLAENPSVVEELAGLVRVIDVNRAALSLYGAHTKEELLNGVPLTFTDASRPVFRDELIALAANEVHFEAECDTRTLAGEVNHVAVRVVVAPGCEQTLEKVFVSITDITEKMRAEARLQRILHLERSNTRRKRIETHIKASLREKEVLLREIHHRVKNNLQIISSLLRLGEEHIRDAKARALFRDSRNRIRSMALIHEKLYQSPDMSRIPFHDYVRSLIHELYSAHSALERRIDLDLQMSEMDLTIETAVPCGLIINELVTNALEHAFPEEVDVPLPTVRKIQLIFRRVDADRFLLQVADNGIGIPLDQYQAKRKSLGLDLVAMLAEQLGGLIEFTQGQGTCCTIMFPERRTR